MGMITNNTESRDKLEEEILRLETIDDGVSKKTLPEVKLDEIDYTAPSDEFLKISAEKELADYRKNGEKALRDKSADDVKTMSDSRAAYANSRDGELAALSEKYADAVRAVDNDAVKRGLARSSVAAVGRSELESEYFGRNASVIEDYGRKIAALDAEISAADGKLRAALDDFNLSYATKLNAKLKELKSERDRKIAEVTEFNNAVRAKQAELDAARAKTESELYTEAQKQQKNSASLDGASSERRDAIYKSVYAKMDEYLASMSPQQARLEIRNHSLYKQHLSPYYYSRLYDKYGR